MKTVSIIIPVFNEAATVGAVVKSVLNWPLPGWRKQVIVIDDGSSDGSRQLLESWKKQIILICKPKNEGKGSAIQTGISKAAGEVIIIQDADLEYTPTDYPKLLEPFSNERVTVVYGSRFLGGHLSTFFIYEQGNKFVTMVTNILFNTNITDMETGYKVFRKTALSDIVLRAKRFDFEPEFTAKILKKGLQIYEVPIAYYGRKFADGKKLTWRDGVAALWALIYYRFFD